jgi:NTP pyrophosphatase (non-canonical NTP hydrolase)
MTFDQLRAANLERLASAWPTEDPWEPWDWTNATSGEVGEACAEGLALLAALSAKAGAAANLTKKMNRVWPSGQFTASWNKPEDQRIADLSARLANELADVVIYADLLASKLGRSLGDCVREKFNAKSDEIGSSVKLPEVVSAVGT